MFSLCNTPAGLAVQESGLLDLLTDAIQRQVPQLKSGEVMKRYEKIWSTTSGEYFPNVLEVYFKWRQLSSSPWLLIVELILAGAFAKNISAFFFS